MRHITENLLNSTRNSNLYCVWVLGQDEERGRLTAIWIDPAMTSFKSWAPEATDGIGTAGFVAEQEQSEEEELGNAIEE